MSIISGGSSGGVTAGQLTTAVGGVNWSVVTKTLDESVTSSAVLQNDDELFFTPVNGGAYEVELYITYLSPGGATPGIAITFGQDATQRGALGGVSYTTGLAASYALFGCVNNAVGAARGTATTLTSCELKGFYIGTGALVNFLWCQSVSNVNAVTVKAGSILRYRRYA